MRISLVNTYDAHGGAARAAMRLFRALRADGAQCELVVAHRERDERGVRAVHGRAMTRVLARIDAVRARLALAPYAAARPPGLEAFEPNGRWLGRNLPAALRGADVVNLHWVAELLDVQTLPLIAARAPVVWTLHDQLPLTGGCHYDGGCTGFLRSCGRCPQLGSRSEGDVSRRNLEGKRLAMSRVPGHRLHFVTPSRWLARQVERSPLGSRFPVTTIPNSVDTDVFKPSDRAESRARLGLPHDRTIVLFMAQHIDNRRKGLHLLLRALEGLQDLRERLLLVSVGNAEALPALALERRHIPYTEDDVFLASVFGAADAFVLPSLQDNLPNTALESLACAIPVIAFSVGGIPELVRDGETGWLAPASDAAALGAAIRRVVDDPAGAARMGLRGREEIMKNASPAVQAGRYRDHFARMARL